MGCRKFEEKKRSVHYLQLSDFEVNLNCKIHKGAFIQELSLREQTNKYMRKSCLGLSSNRSIGKIFFSFRYPSVFEQFHFMISEGSACEAF